MPALTASSLSIDGIEVAIVRKPIKTLRLAVYPDGRVRLSVPLRTREGTVRAFLLARLDWIKRHHRSFAERPVPPSLEYRSGELHFLRGATHLLTVIEDDRCLPKVVLHAAGGIDLYVHPGADAGARQKVLDNWYRELLRQAIPPLIAKWEARMGVTVAAWGIRKMRSRWGTCNVAARRIWISLALAQKPHACLEYIVVHEMAHLLERSHGPRFVALMDHFYPTWRECKAELNRVIPLHEAEDCH